jgi:hypothetical protein
VEVDREGLGEVEGLDWEERGAERGCLSLACFAFSLSHLLTCSLLSLLGFHSSERDVSSRARWNLGI